MHCTSLVMGFVNWTEEMFCLFLIIRQLSWASAVHSCGWMLITFVWNRFKVLGFADFQLIKCVYHFLADKFQNECYFIIRSMLWNWSIDIRRGSKRLSRYKTLIRFSCSTITQTPFVRVKKLTRDAAQGEIKPLNMNTPAKLRSDKRSKKCIIYPQVLNNLFLFTSGFFLN